MIGTKAKKGNWEKKRERKQQNKGNLIILKYRGSSRRERVNSSTNGCIKRMSV